jgi:HEAT repeat protein
MQIENIDRLATQGAPALAQLTAMLDDPSWTIRRAVVGALASHGELAFRSLTEVLLQRSPNESALAAAVEAFVASTADPTAILLNLTKNENPAIALDAVQILGRRKSAQAVPRLVELIKHSDDNVVVGAIEALGRIGGSAAVEALIGTLSTGNFFRVFPAIGVLGRTGDPRAVPVLAQLVSDATYESEAIKALARTANASAATSIASLLTRASDLSVRTAALGLVDLRERHRERFGSYGPVDETLRRTAPIEKAVLRLMSALEGADQEERVAIATVLGILGSETAVPALTELLGAAPRVADAAASALHRLSQESDAELRQALREGDSTRRRMLLPVVSRASSLVEVMTCLTDSDARVRALACDAIARVGNTTSVDALFRLLEDQSSTVVHAAVGAIQSLGTSSTEPLARTAAQSSTPSVRRAALGILAYFGIGLDLLLAAVDDPVPEVREAAIQGLAFIDDARALDRLLATSKSPEPRTRSAAMRALSHTANDPRVDAHLLRGLQDSDAWVRYFACQSLGKRGAARVTNAILPLLDDPAGQVRVAAVEALSRFDDEAAFAALEKAAASPDADLTRAALVALGLTRKGRAVSTLKAALGANEVATRLLAISSLALLPPADAAPLLAQAANDPDADVRNAALDMLGPMNGAEAARALVAAVIASPEDRRAKAALSRGAHGRVAAITEALETASGEAALELASSLVRLGAEDALIVLLESQNVETRRVAATALGPLSSARARAAFARLADHDPDEELRRLCRVLAER